MKKIKSNHYLASAFLILLFSVMNAFSQAVIKTGEGFLFVNNDKSKSFTLEINGRELKPLESQTPMFMVDGKLLQILIVEQASFAPQNKKLNDEELLEAHKIWESNYLEKEIYKKKLAPEAEKISFGERKALFWGFTRPALNEQFDRDYFLTTIVGDYLLTIGSPAAPNQKKAETQKFLTDMLKTIKVSDKEFDIEKLSDEIRRAPAKNQD